ncbi:hypothetical protein D3C80_1475540 [compost metagenome]
MMLRQDGKQLLRHYDIPGNMAVILRKRGNKRQIHLTRRDILDQGRIGPLLEAEPDIRVVPAELCHNGRNQVCSQTVRKANTDFPQLRV